MRAAIPTIVLLSLCIGCKSSTHEPGEAQQGNGGSQGHVTAPPSALDAGPRQTATNNDAGHTVMSQLDAATAEPDAAEPDSGPVASGPCMVMAEDDRLDGVRLLIEGDSCRVETARDHTFRYTLEVDAPISYSSPYTFNGCGRCGGYTSDPRSLIDFSIGADDTWYCLCDQGCCPPTMSSMQTLQTGSFEGDIEWPGKEWQGPSDTDNPLGHGFPAGDYAVSVTFSVPGVGSITARLPIEVYGDPGPVPASCEVDGVIYASGQGGIGDPQSCNTCTCNDGQLVCTEIGCAEPCPDGTEYGTSCSQCGPTDACEVLRSGCLPTCTTSNDCINPALPICNDGVCRNLCG